jgi:hypothetical protein
MKLRGLICPKVLVLFFAVGITELLEAIPHFLLFFIDGPLK